MEIRLPYVSGGMLDFRNWTLPFVIPCQNLNGLTKCSPAFPDALRSWQSDFLGKNAYPLIARLLPIKFKGIDGWVLLATDIKKSIFLLQSAPINTP